MVAVLGMPVRRTLTSGFGAVLLTQADEQLFQLDRTCLKNGISTAKELEADFARIQASLKKLNRDDPPIHRIPAEEFAHERRRRFGSHHRKVFLGFTCAEFEGCPDHLLHSVRIEAILRRTNSGQSGDGFASRSKD